MKPMKVLEVIRQGQIGGGESHVLDLVLGFDLRQVEPVVMAFTDGHMMDVLREKGIRCYVIPTDKAFDRQVQRSIREVLLQEHIELIHAHGSRAASNVFWLAHSLHLPLVYTVHGWSFHSDQNKMVYWLRSLSEKLICRYASQVICVSESNRQTGERAFGLRSACVIENGIDLERFNPANRFKDIRKELGVDEGDFLVGFMARMTLQKSPLDFVRSIALAHDKDKRIKGLLVGEGDMKQEVHALIRQNGWTDLFYLSDFRTDVPDVLHAMDVYCLPSLWEGLSIALLEAMAMEKPLVVTPTDGTREIVRTEENGLVVSFNRPEALADAYLEYLDHPDRAREYGRHARQAVESRFDSRRVSEEVTEIYRRELGMEDL